MFVVHFFENKNLLLSQLLKDVPPVDEHVTIKGRKGKVSSVNLINEKNIHVHVILENISKNKTNIDLSKKKKK